MNKPIANWNSRSNRSCCICKRKEWSNDSGSNRSFGSLGKV